MTQINITEEINQITNFSNFKNINLFDYQIKTIEKLLQHEFGQMKINNFNHETLKNLFNYIRFNIIYKKKSNSNLYEDFEKKLHRKYNNNDNIIFNYNIGILSNKVGSGKTIITLGLIMSRKIFNQEKIIKNTLIHPVYNNTNLDYDTCSIIAEYLLDKYDFSLNTNNHYLNNHDNLFFSDNTNNTHLSTNLNLHYIKNLIIVPHNLFEQWEDEINSKTTLTFYSIKNKKNLNNIDYIKNNDVDIVLCNINKLKDFLTQIKDKYYILRTFIDEVDTINLSNFPEINSEFLWLITTTFKRIQYPKNFGFIRNLFNPYNHISQNLIYSFLLNKLTFTFDTNYIDHTVDLKIPNKKYIVVPNNFINKLLYNLQKKSTYTYINSYDYPNLFHHLNQKHNIFFLLSDLLSLKKNFNRHVFYDNFYSTDFLAYENTSSILFIIIIKYLNNIKNNIENIFLSFNSLDNHLENIKLHLCNCRNCSPYSNIYDISELTIYTLISDLLKDKIPPNNCRMLKVLFNNIKENESKIKTIHTLLKKNLYDYEYIIDQLSLYNYCRSCLHIHNSDQECNNSIFKNIFNMYNTDLNEFDFIINKYNILTNYNLIKNFDTPYNKKIKNISSVSNNDINLKIKHMIDFLKNDIHNKKKSILFSDNYHFFNIIQNELDNNDIKHRVLKGNSNTINSILKKFQNNQIDVLLMNMKFSGSGINLQMSDNIYIMNMIDNNTETQVIGRVNRINKKNNFEIFYFFTDNEYDLYNQREINNNDNSPREEVIIEEI